MKPLSELSAEYAVELAKRGLPQLSADELLHEDLSEADRRYVSDFYNRYEEVENYLAKLREDIRVLDTGHDPELVRELLEEYRRLNGFLPHGFELPEQVPA